MGAKHRFQILGATWLCVATLSLASPAYAQDAPAPAPAPADEAPPEPAPEPEPPPSEARAPHPEPRVIVTVERLRGPHDKGAVERAARQAWGRIVRCYNLAKEDTRKPPKGNVVARVEIRGSGEVADARRLGGSLKGEVARCLTRTMRRVDMPKARAGSTVEVKIQIAPGDRDAPRER